MKALKQLFSGIRNIFRREHLRDEHLRDGQMYAVTAGKYLGEFFVYIDRDSVNVKFLSLPSLEKRHVPRVKFDIGVSTTVLEPIEVVSGDVYKLCKAQYDSINS